MRINRRTFGASLLAAGMGLTAQVANSQGSRRARDQSGLRLIATEEAFVTPEQVAAMRKIGTGLLTNPDLEMWKTKIRSLDTETSYSPIMRAMMDLGATRLADMDNAGVAMQVLSLNSPGVQMFDADTAKGVARDSNDRLAEAVRQHPTRFAGLASFAPQDPPAAAKEIERAIMELGLHGLVVNSHTSEEYLDLPKYWPIFEAAEALNAAIYIHPRNPPAAFEPFLQLPEASTNLQGAIWGFALDTGLHAARLIFSGVFDRFPKLKIVLGHMGEGLPYWLFRMDQRYRRRGAAQSARGLQRLPSDYVKENFLVTTSGVFWHASLKFCCDVLGADNVMFAIDYPMEDSQEAAQFMRSAPLDAADLEKVAYGNAERVFRIRSA